VPGRDHQGNARGCAALSAPLSSMRSPRSPLRPAAPPSDGCVTALSSGLRVLAAARVPARRAPSPSSCSRQRRRRKRRAPLLSSRPTPLLNIGFAARGCRHRVRHRDPAPERREPHPLEGHRVLHLARQGRVGPHAGGREERVEPKVRRRRPGDALPPDPGAPASCPSLYSLAMSTCACACVASRAGQADRRCERRSRAARPPRLFVAAPLSDRRCATP
jgi:hypothetical protein